MWALPKQDVRQRAIRGRHFLSLTASKQLVRLSGGSKRTKCDCARVLRQREGVNLYKPVGSLALLRILRPRCFFRDAHGDCRHLTFIDDGIIGLRELNSSGHKVVSRLPALSAGRALSNFDAAGIDTDFSLKMSRCYRSRRVVTL